MDVAAYLRRIGIPAAPPADLQSLRVLHRQHQFTVPFENLDIARGVPLSLEDDALFQKVVTRRRGGFCYELNGLFARLLGALGYRVDLLSARVFNDDGVEGPPFDHLALRVRLDQPWLCDVGFGEGFREPIALDVAGTQRIGDREYRVQPSPHGGVVQARAHGSDWLSMYSFESQPRSMADFEAMFHYHQTSPESSFTQRTTCTLATPDGRVTLRNQELIETVGAQRTVTALGEDQVAATLRERFGI